MSTWFGWGWVKGLVGLTDAVVACATECECPLRNREVDQGRSVGLAPCHGSKGRAITPRTHSPRLHPKPNPRSPPAGP